MTKNSKTVRATPSQVWQVLADGWLYPSWVVGAARMREVSDTWPQKGALLHHSVGAWPFLLSDTSEVLEVREPELLRLRVRGWPVGSAEVVMRLKEAGDDSTEVTMEEYLVGGPARRLPRSLVDLGLRHRNTEALRRLSFLAERRVSSRSDPPTDHEDEGPRDGSRMV